MNTRKSLLVVFSVMFIAAFMLSACQPVETTVEVVKTVEVPGQEVVVTVEVEVPGEEVTVVETQVVEVEREAFTTPHPILGDLKVRQALSHCINKLDLVKSVYPLASEESQQAAVIGSWIAPFHWAYPGDENITIYEYDPAKAAALFEEAGWTLGEGATVRTNEAGETLSLKFTTTTATFRQTWAAVLEQQMAECGVEMIRLHAPASWWFGDTTGLARRDFELGAYAWVGQVDPGGQTLYSCDQINSPANNWEGQNYPGWCNEEATAALKNANNTLLQEDRKRFYAEQQALWTADIPVIPLFNRVNTFATRADLEGFDPKPGEEYYTYNIQDWAIPGGDTLVLGFTQEPASMYGLVEDAYVMHEILMMMGAERAWTSQNYEFQPLQLTEMPTLESGKSENVPVAVSAGDTVIDANGDIVEAAAGVMVINSDGETVEFTDGVMMNQLTVNFEYRSDLTWPDGEPLKAEDLELGWNNKCDKDSGATSFITCDRTASVSFEGTTFTRAEWPGGQDPLYQAMANYYIYPAHRELSDGRVLADVPAAEWATLPEIAEQPWGFGPYHLTEWVKGEKMVFEAHPYYYGGAPTTPNAVVAFVTPENAEAQLLGGQVDTLGAETLVGVTEALDAAAQEGKLNVVVIPSTTWEHIDLALFVK